MSAELTPDGKGGFVETEDTDASTDAPTPTDGEPTDGEPTDVDKADDEPAPEPSDEDVDKACKPGHKSKKQEKPEDEKKPPPFMGKQKLAMPMGVKSAATKLVTEALERLMSVANSIKGASVDNKAPAMPPDLAREVRGIASVLNSITEKYPNKAAKSEDDENLEAALRSVGADDETVDALSKLVGDPIAKAGARMKRERLERFQKAMELLNVLLREFVGEVAEATNARKRDDEPAKPDNETLAKLTKRVEELTALAEEQRAKIERIGKSAPISGQLPVEGRVSATDNDDPVWPLDMNRPITRDSVDKSLSFFDDE